MKVTTVMESKDFFKISTFELFSNLKAHELDINKRKEVVSSSSKVTTLVAVETNSATEDEDSHDDMTLFVKQFKMFVNLYGRPVDQIGSNKKDSNQQLKVRKESFLNLLKLGICVIIAGNQIISSTNIHALRPKNSRRMKELSEQRKQVRERTRALLSELEKAK